MDRDEFADTTARKFITMLFTSRATRLLTKMASIYGWTPEQYAQYEQKFVIERGVNFVPEWSEVPSDYTHTQ